MASRSQDYEFQNRAIKKRPRMIKELSGRALAMLPESRMSEVLWTRQSKPSDILTSPSIMWALRRTSEPLRTSKKRSGTGSSALIFAVFPFQR
jgi:hypothetical protein